MDFCADQKKNPSGSVLIFLLINVFYRGSHYRDLFQEAGPEESNCILGRGRGMGKLSVPVFQRKPISTYDFLGRGS